MSISIQLQSFDQVTTKLQSSLQQLIRSGAHTEHVPQIIRSQWSRLANDTKLERSWPSKRTCDLKFRRLQSHSVADTQLDRSRSSNLWIICWDDYWLLHRQIVNKHSNGGSTLSNRLQITKPIATVSYRAVCHKHQVSTSCCSSPSLPRQALLLAPGHPGSWPCRCCRDSRNKDQIPHINETRVGSEL